jgi:hypothetical protein
VCKESEGAAKVLLAEIDSGTTLWGILLGNRNQGQRQRFSETIIKAIAQTALLLIQIRAVGRSIRPRLHLNLWVEVMGNLLDFAMLICASLGAMAFGILAAFGILRAGFALMRPQRLRTPVKPQPEVARVS